MGTRCITVVEDEEGNELCRIFRGFDGYPSVHGDELVAFLARGRVQERIEMTDEKSFLGMGDVASSLITYLKSYREDHKDPSSRSKKWREPSPVGNKVSLMPAGTKNVGEDYIYTVVYQGDNQFTKVDVVSILDGKRVTLLS